MQLKTMAGAIDPEGTCWSLRAGRTGRYYVNVIRIFYEGADPSCKQIGELFKHKNHDID